MASASRSAADLAVDLGSARTRIALRGRGVVVDVPTVVALSGTAPMELVAVGDEAAKMWGRAPEGTRVIRPVRGGVIADPVATERLLAALLRRLPLLGLRRPRVVVCVPTGLDAQERAAVHDCAKAAGAVSVTLVPAPLAAAAGADLPVREPVGSLLIDVGAGRTQVAVLSLGGIVVRGSVPVAGDALDASIVDWVRRERGVAVGERAAEELKIQVASLTPSVHADLRWRVRGRAEATGHPEEVEVDAEGLADALEEPVSRIRRVLRDTLGQVPPELAGDIVERGLWTCGGTSKLRGLDAVLRHDTAMPVLQPEGAEHCAIRGAARMLEDVRWLEQIGRAPG